MRALGFCWDEKKAAAIPILIECLGDRDVRLEAAEALGKIAWGDREAIPRLIDGLKDPDPAYRATVAEALGRMGWESPGRPRHDDPARGAVTPLIAALKDPGPRVRQHAATALGDIGTESHRAIPDLVALLEDRDPEVRLAVLRSFPRLGSLPVASRETVLRLMKDTDPRIRLAATTILGGDALGSEDAVAGLLAALKDPDAEVRAAAAADLSQTNGRQGISLDEHSIRSYYQSGAALAGSPGAGRRCARPFRRSGPARPLRGGLCLADLPTRGGRISSAARRPAERYQRPRAARRRDRPGPVRSRRPRGRTCTPRRDR